MTDRTSRQTPLTWLLLDSSGIGGIESHVAELAAGLAEAGDRVRVVFLADHGPHPLRARLGSEGVPWECLDGSLLTLIGRLRGPDRPALLHTHGYKANLLGRAAALVSGVPAVATYHAGERPPGMVGLYDWADRWTSFVGRRIAVSRAIQERLPFGATLIPNFVALPPSGPPPSGPSPAERPDVVAFVGRMSPEKGPDLFCALADAAPGPAYVAFGGGPMLDGLRASHAARVAFRGPMAGMGQAWPTIGLLALTSRAEGLPLAVLEAMAHGVPVAGFAVGGLPDAIEDGVSGYIAPPGDVAALAERVGRWRALDDVGKAAMSDAARARIASRYSRDAGVAATRASYPGRQPFHTQRR